MFVVQSCGIAADPRVPLTAAADPPSENLSIGRSGRTGKGEGGGRMSGSDTFDWVLSFPNSPQDDDVKVFFNAQHPVSA